MNEINTTEDQLRAEVEALRKQLNSLQREPAANAGPSGGTLLVLVLMLAGLVAAGYFLGYLPRQRREHVLAAEAQVEGSSLPVVNVEPVTRSARDSSLLLPGNIQAITEAPVLARASGYIRKRYVDIGDRVTAGQVLAEIEAPELEQQIKQAGAAIDQANSTIQQAEAALEQGQANANLAKVNAQRYANLLAKGVVSRQDNDTYQAQFEAQQANVQALGKAVAAARSNAAAAQANLARLHELQGYQTVRAPFAGVITLRNIDSGVLVNEGNTLLFRIAQTDRLRLYVNVPQAQSGSVRRGQAGQPPDPRHAGPEIQRHREPYRQRARPYHPHPAGGTSSPQPVWRAAARNVRAGGSLDFALQPASADTRRYPGRQERRSAGSGGERRWRRAFHAHPAGPRLRRPPGSAVGARGRTATGREPERRSAGGSPREAGNDAPGTAEEIA